MVFPTTSINKWDYGYIEKIPYPNVNFILNNLFNIETKFCENG